MRGVTRKGRVGGRGKGVRGSEVQGRSKEQSEIKEGREEEREEKEGRKKKRGFSAFHETQQRLDTKEKLKKWKPGNTKTSCLLYSFVITPQL